MGEAILLGGFAALALPTILRLGQLSWSTEAGAHGPIVFATAIWLVWRESDCLRAGVRQPLWPGALLLLIALPLYAIGRITSILMLESLSLYLILLTLVFLRYGGAVLRRLWFPFVYALFLITPPENWIFVATRPLKMALSEVSVDLLSAAGLAVGSSGSMIQVGGYQLLVAAACSGVNSLIGIGAISLFYVYLRHGSEPRYAFVLLLLLLPIAVLTNLLRIMGMVLATHWFGPGVVEGIAHDVAGIGTFAVALALLFGIDAVLFPLFRRSGWVRD
ncbi:exosortase [Altericroceibacterium xinjiangense]|uniref:exosortase n=1 Tax=Altericroceibacterium xinjiangense TaxID=762261 RepID=UPI0013DFD374|nr:exosortase [Altericroceibacterium xinjiangense]